MQDNPPAHLPDALPGPRSGWQHRLRCDQTAAWPQLARHFAQHFVGPAAFDLRQAFAQDAQRAAHFSLQAPQVFADLSKNLIDDTARDLLNQLASQCGLPAWRNAMLAGAPVNVSENRPATHTQWRSGGTAAPAIRDMLAHMLGYAEAVRADAAITDVVNIGIGGSDLGPHMVVQALRTSGHANGPRLHFISNMDGHQLAALLPALRPQHTLFIVASKTFGTAETLRNAASARQWFTAQGGQNLGQHFVAISANTQAATQFGAGQCFGFDEGVGGRYSLWSPIGLSIAIAAGAQGFEALQAGGRAMDEHFAQAPLPANLPVQLALLDLWYGNFHGFASRCVAPYHHGLRNLPAYLQQLEMESNGKRVDTQGHPLPFASAPVTWGQAGSNGQHAFFQALHQGTQVIPVEFVLVRQSAHALPGHHPRLLANALAQARALMLGQEGDAPERHFPGNRPSTVLLLPELSPTSLGALLALYEHRTASLGALWGLNSFDQWGVELGKRHAGDIETCLTQGGSDGMDGSTALLLEKLRPTS